VIRPRSGSAARNPEKRRERSLRVAGAAAADHVTGTVVGDGVSPLVLVRLAPLERDVRRHRVEMGVQHEMRPLAGRVRVLLREHAPARDDLTFGPELVERFDDELAHLVD